MAVIRQEPTSEGLFSKLVQYSTTLYFSVADRIKKRRTYLKTLRELNLMTDRDLADIGFSRSEIKSRALKSIYKINI
jgi:uncharacterized protein YjiS (DUF1127 family)